MVKYYNLPEKFIVELEKLPESGMGYQIVNIKFTNGSTLNNVVVLNSEIIKVEDDTIIDVEKIDFIELTK